MDKYSMMVALSGQICGTILLVTLITAWVGRRRRSNAALADGGLERLEVRLTEMQQSLDAVAIEVERISEGQRFATKLLADRAAVQASDINGARDSSRIGQPR
jgi:hypothetical protein